MASRLQAWVVMPSGTGTTKRTSRPMAMEMSAGTILTPTWAAAAGGAGAGWPAAAPPAAAAAARTCTACRPARWGSGGRRAGCAGASRLGAGLAKGLAAAGLQGSSVAGRRSLAAPRPACRDVMVACIATCVPQRAQRSAASTANGMADGAPSSRLERRLRGVSIGRTKPGVPLRQLLTSATVRNGSSWQGSRKSRPSPAKTRGAVGRLESGRLCEPVAAAGRPSPGSVRWRRCERVRGPCRHPCAG
jgi:hypothetical protein